jgi:hypothetical protein
MEIGAYLASVEAAVADADVALTTELGGYQEVTMARVWHGQVLVDWEPDATAGGCLLRPDLLQRLIALHAQVSIDADTPDAGSLQIVAPGLIVAALSPEHARLVTRLGGARRVELRACLRFDQARQYRGGCETYFLLERGQRVSLLRLSAAVSPRRSPATR